MKFLTLVLVLETLVSSLVVASNVNTEIPTVGASGSISSEDYCLGSMTDDGHFFNGHDFYELVCTTGSYQSKHVKTSFVTGLSNGVNLDPILRKSVLEPLETKGYKLIGWVDIGLDVVTRGADSQDEISKFCLLDIRTFTNPARNPPVAQIHCGKGALLLRDQNSNILNMTPNEAQATLQLSGYAKVAVFPGDVYLYKKLH
jgi:hypothetical protein